MEKVTCHCVWTVESSSRGTEGWTGLSYNDPVEMMDRGTFQLERFVGFFFILSIIIQFSVAATNPHKDRADDADHSDCRGV